MAHAEEWSSTLPDDRRRRFNALFEATRRQVLAYALRRTREPADAEDVAAETFAVAWRRLDDIPPGELALPWLFGVARRLLANQRRGSDRRWHLLTRLFERTSLVADPPDVHPDGGPALAALARLRPDDRELLQLLAWEELGHAAIAATLGISVNAVAIRLRRARKRFAEVYAGLLEVDAETLKGFDPIRTSTPVMGGVEGRPGQDETR